MFLKAPKDFVEIEAWLPTKIHIGKNGIGTKKEWLWFGVEADDENYFEQVTEQTLQETIDATQKFLDQLFDLRDKIQSD